MKATELVETLDIDTLQIQEFSGIGLSGMVVFRTENVKKIIHNRCCFQINLKALTLNENRMKIFQPYPMPPQ